MAYPDRLPPAVVRLGFVVSLGAIMMQSVALVYDAAEAARSGSFTGRSALLGVQPR
ncbi:MAG: hypothetical protein JXA67_16360 [Micromonosporaceae bacterium]|nr:hypothetical protein [Micromonosporaceae bacterium]